jgi:uncharacterized membrane protein YdjX (TVP38/TMEM64 family)
MKLNIQRKHISAFIGIAFVVLFLYLTTLIKAETVEQISTELGFAGILIVALVILATQIFAPFSGTIGLFVGYKLYGYGFTLIVFYFVSMLSAIINFYISKRYGRKYVIKLVGQDNMNFVDTVVATDAKTILIGLRIFGYFFFDFISYALGLTKISFRRYFIFTAALTPIPITIQYFIFRGYDFNSPKHITIYYISIFLSSLIATRILYRIYLKRKENIK